MKKFHLEVGDPVVIEQGAVGDQEWGHYQFPNLYRTTRGHIGAGWGYASDTIEYTSHVKEGIRTAAVSEDEGKTWRDKTPEDVPYYPVLMKNGKRWVGFCGKPAHPVEYIEKYTPVCSGTARVLRTLYYADDIEEKDDLIVTAMEEDPVTGEITTFPCEIHWPHRTLTGYTNNRVYPSTMVFALCNGTGLMEMDGDLYFVTYTAGLDPDAPTREEAIPKYPGCLNTYVFKSTDCGRTWEYLSRHMTNDFTFGGAMCDGLGEAMMAQVPDGSVVMLIRSGDTLPSFITRSTDKCKTWSPLKVFDDCGVLPQILTLPCGVTLSTYGRPVLKVRATADPAAMEWQDPIELDLYAMKMPHYINRSCFYTRMVPLSDTSVLMIYTDFQYPNKDGEGVKTVLTRTITVVED